MMRKQRKKQPWWLTVVGVILALGMTFAAILVGSYISDNFDAWAAPLTWTALIVGILASVSYFWPGVPGWQVAPVIGFTITFCLGESAIHGWDSQFLTGLFILKVIYIVGSVGLFAAAIWWVWRRNRVLASLTREIGEQIHTDALFRDDGERITAYANKRRVLTLFLGQVVATALVVLGFIWALTANAGGLIPIMLVMLLALCGLSTMLSAIRLMRQSPTLVVGPDGVLDNASLFAAGRGLIRWDEIVTIFQYDRKANNITKHLLAIMVTDGVRIRRRLPAWKRLLGLMYGTDGPTLFIIASSVLDRNAAVLALEIKHYAAQHAPKGWHSPLIEGTDESASDGAQAD